MRIAGGADTRSRPVTAIGSRRGYGCPNITDIVTPCGLFPPPLRKNWA
ncbi:hypothetical protein Taro_055654 [Colocasia esculenta]|uniref:Uncharacterized protein n=1 Tax=Colocasia esculenta TaxID=4460 RepID=A0A843XRZ5_COLES|nr:hypothetical protein [Colocasia esculenta]